MIKILSIVGARPQFVKAAALSREIANNAGIEETIVHTGQHFDIKMSDIFFDEMQIPKPKYNLEINSLSHGAMTGRMLESIENIILKEKPSLVLVYGDTNSTLAGALAAKKLHVKVGHVEAGLRSFNMKMPEEINRILTDRISDFLFCPTDMAIENLRNEGFDSMNCQIIKTGDVMLDAAYFYARQSQEKSTILKELKLEKFAICTIHRAENTDDLSRLQSIISALNKINQKVKVILPIHPRTKTAIETNNIKVEFNLIDPVGYFDMIELLKNCSLVFTDSGGLQKEAFFFEKKCITMRDQTEWVELVAGGFNVLTGADEARILTAFDLMANRKSDFKINLYGNGTAAKVIVDILKGL